MKQKIFKLKYYVGYDPTTAPPVYPNNLVLLASGGVAAGPPGTSLPPPPPPDRMLFSYRREIKNKKNGTTIGDASYLIHAYKVETSNDKKTGAIYGTFTAHHQLEKKGHEWDIMYSGNSKWSLGERPGLIDPSVPFLNIINSEIDNVTAINVFKDGEKINHGNNKTTLSDGIYQIKGIYDMIDF